MKQFLSCSYAKTNFFLKSDKKINKFLKTLTFWFILLEFFYWKIIFLKLGYDNFTFIACCALYSFGSF